MITDEKGESKDDTGASAEQLDLARRKKEKVRKLALKKAREKDLDRSAQATSSLAVGSVRKAAVDWDFEEGDHSDDEEGPGSEVEQDVDVEEEDVGDSEEEDETALTQFGENLSRMLETQKLREADDELEQFSDEDDDAAAPRKPTTGVTNAADTPSNKSSKFAGTSAGTSGGSGTGDSSGKTSGPAGAEVQPLKDEKAELKERVLEVFRREKNVTVKVLLQQLGINTKNSKFDYVKELIAKICSVQNMPMANNTTIRILVLKESHNQGLAKGGGK